MRLFSNSAEELTHMEGLLNAEIEGLLCTLARGTNRGFVEQ